MDALLLPHQSFDMSGGSAMGSGEQFSGDEGFPSAEDIKPAFQSTQRAAAHQCNICNKLFISFKGLQQHAIIHTDQKPFTCEICNKSFRFKSNLFEHKSVHSTNGVAHACPYCGKACRLKGNLKKHIRTHVSSKEELEEAWKPFASNRRPPAEVPVDAIIFRSNGETAMFTPPARPRKRKLGLGNDARLWIEKIPRILPSETLDAKLERFRDMIKMLQTNGVTLKMMLEKARTIAFEKFECPMCKTVFQSRGECSEHLDLEHPLTRVERPLFCEICLKSFVDRKSLEQHESYHKRVHLLVENGELELNDPEILVPSIEDEVDNSVSDQNEQIQNQMPQIKYDDSVPVSTDPSQIQDGHLFSHDPSQNEDGQLF
jgi:phage FluMu protein Com